MVEKTNITFILQAYQIIKKQATVNTIENFTKPTISLNFIFLQRWLSLSYNLETSIESLVI